MCLTDKCFPIKWHHWREELCSFCKFLLNLADFNFSPFLCWMVRIPNSVLPARFSTPNNIWDLVLFDLIVIPFQCRTTANGSPSPGPWAAASHSGVALLPTPKHTFACILILTAHWGCEESTHQRGMRARLQGPLMAPPILLSTYNGSRWTSYLYYQD